ncbi:ZIP family metal transporter [Rhodocyclaceae bacterium]|nr:ZIP family metal transporter [Rhodocyclaceae bacterium]
MTARLARLHFKPGNPAGLARALAGWVIALLGLGLLAMQGSAALPRIDAPLHGALTGGAMAALATGLGALPVLITRRIGAGAQGMLLGFGAGVMLAAAVFSLLIPGIAAAEALGRGRTDAVLTVVVALCAGALALLALDRALPHDHAPNAQRSAKAVWLFVFAIAVHNIPEGLAIGVAAGQASAQAVATGISLQNVPEGLIVAMALAAAGYGRALAFAVAAASGVVEPAAALAGSLAVSQSAALLPWGLGAAAGAMLFVVSHEIIPESHRRGHETLATAGLVVGFVGMLLMDNMLG